MELVNYEVMGMSFSVINFHLVNSFYGMNYHCKLRDTGIDIAGQLLKKDMKVSVRELSGNLNVLFRKVHHVIISELGTRKEGLLKSASKLLLFLNKTLTSYP
jgi:hypothetical protein